MNFTKYHGTGNDFVMIDGRSLSNPDDLFSTEVVRQICRRRFGVGADGLIILKEKEGYDFFMDYFNADGKRSSMCGNGARCAMHFARALGVIENEATFYAPDGPHDGHFEGDVIAVKMNVGEAENLEEKDWWIDTGSPHYVRYVDDLSSIDVNEEGAGIRYSPHYQEHGVNVNFVQRSKETLLAATYERGVEAETFSCGTGVTACALVELAATNQSSGRVEVQTKGGTLWVDVSELGVWLLGPAQAVFSGKLDL